MPNLDVRTLLHEPELRLTGGVVVERVLRTGIPQINNFGEKQRIPATTVILDPVVIHNSGGKDLRRLEEADRSTAHVSGYSEQRVYMGDGDYDPDVVRYNSRRWRVDHVEDYDTQGGVWIWMAALIEEGAG